MAREDRGAMLKGLGRRRKGETRVVIPLALGALALGFVVWFMVSTAPRGTLNDVANVAFTVTAPEGAVPKLNLSGDAALTPEGDARVKVQTYFVCEAATRLVIKVTSQETLDVEFASTGNISTNGKLSDLSVRSTATGLEVSGSCSEAQPVDIAVNVIFPAETISVPLARGRYAFGLDLFALNEADYFSVPS